MNYFINIRVLDLILRLLELFVTRHKSGLWTLSSEGQSHWTEEKTQFYQRIIGEATFISISIYPQEVIWVLPFNLIILSTGIV